MSAYPWVSLNSFGGRRIALAQPYLGNEAFFMHRLPLLGHLCPFQRDWFAADGALDWSLCYRHGRGSNPLVRSRRLAEGSRVPLGEEGHSDSDFFLIFFYDRSQKGNEVLNPPGILLVEDVSAELAHEIGVVHRSGPPQTRQSHTRQEGVKYRKLCMVSNRRF
jgi:hypothetical protein